MRGLPWLLPSVVAGSFRTALVKAGNGDFSGDTPLSLLENVSVAGVFPVHNEELYLPAPTDCVAEPNTDGSTIKAIHQVTPQPLVGGCDFLPENDLRPVMLSETQSSDDFKPMAVPAWWPLSKYADWLFGKTLAFDPTFLNAARQETRDHVQLDDKRGAAEEGLIFSTTGLNVSHLPRFGVKHDDKTLRFDERYAQVTLSARVDIAEKTFDASKMNMLHPLGGERRLIHWKTTLSNLWQCPASIATALTTATKIRMVLATPAIFKNGWMPDLVGGPLRAANLKLVGVSNGRWKAISGWSLAPPRGPKAIRRMVPAGSVYFFTCNAGDAANLAKLWLQSVSDVQQEQRDGFGLALWGTW